MFGEEANETSAKLFNKENASDLKNPSDAVDLTEGRIVLQKSFSMRAPYVTHGIGSTLQLLSLV